MYFTDVSEADHVTHRPRAIAWGLDKFDRKSSSSYLQKLPISLQFQQSYIYKDVGRNKANFSLVTEFSIYHQYIIHYFSQTHLH